MRKYFMFAVVLLLIIGCNPKDAGTKQELLESLKGEEKTDSITVTDPEPIVGKTTEQTVIIAEKEVIEDEADNDYKKQTKHLLEAAEFANALQLNAKNTLGAPFISATNTQQSMQSFMHNSEKDILFIENLGQIRGDEGEERPDVLFITRSQGVDMYITSSGITYAFRKTEGDILESADMKKDKIEEPRTILYRLDMEFVGISKNINIKKELAVEQQFNYYTPEHPDGISPGAFKKITIENVYDGIDLVYYEKEGKMKYDFIVKAEADAQKIKMKYNGAENVYLDKNGSVVVTTPMGEIREEKPYTYSRNTGKAIESGYEVKDITVQFDIAEYSKSEDIIIDPFRQWATYYGGGDTEYGWGVCTDNSGNLYVTGYTASTNFPTQTLTGAYNQTSHGGGTRDAFILKFNSSGARIWATYYGGSDIDNGFDICTDNSGNLYVTGETRSSNFPTQTLTGAYNQSVIGGNQDLFILKFSSSGARIWATYYGGNGWDGWDGGYGYNTCTDNSGNLYVTGMTISTDFPTQTLTGAYNQNNLNSSRDAFILKFNSNCSSLWATYYGGNANDWGLGVCTDNSDNLFVNGRTQSTDFPIQIVTGAYNQTTLGGNYDGFLSKFDSNGVCLWCTYYGGYATDYVYNICTDNSGNLYATGITNSDPNLGIGFPTQTLTGAYNQTTFGGGYFDAFILKFNSGCARTWATYYGGSARDEGFGICTDASGNLYLTGTTQSDVNFPVQTLAGAYNQTTYGGGTWDAFILEFSGNGERTWATYYGGDGRDVGQSICMSSSSGLYITGLTRSNNFPTQDLTGAFFQSTIAGEDDAFILKFSTTLDGFISGNVSLEGGIGSVEDVVVTAGSVSTNPNATGLYSIEIEPGIYDVTAALDGYDPETIEGVIVEVGQTTGGIDFTLNPSVGLEDNPLSSKITLIGNFPNPFNPTTTISFSMAENVENAELIICNLKGQKVKTFAFPNRSLGTSEYSVTWDGTDENNQPVSSGIYFYQLINEKNKSNVKKMLLLK